MSLQQVIDYNPYKGRRHKSGNISWTLRTTQPLVLAVCSPEYLFGIDELSYFLNDGSTTVIPKNSSVYEKLQNLNESLTPGNGTRGPAIWMVSPSDSVSVIGAHLWLDEPTRTVAKVCTVSSYWWSSMASLTYVDRQWMLQTESLDARESMKRHALTPITIDPRNVTTLGALRFNDWPYDDYPLLCFAAAIAEIPGHKINWKSTIISEVQDSTLWPSFEIAMIFDGYGYGSTEMSMRLSLAVIISYCLITILYVTYILATGHTSVV